MQQCHANDHAAAFWRCAFAIPQHSEVWCGGQGAAHVSAYVTHGVFPNATWKRFSPQGDGSSANGFKYFWITDSCANTANALQNQAPFEVRHCRNIAPSPLAVSTKKKRWMLIRMHTLNDVLCLVLQVLSLAEPIAAALQI